MELGTGAFGSRILALTHHDLGPGMTLAQSLSFHIQSFQSTPLLEFPSWEETGQGEGSEWHRKSYCPALAEAPSKCDISL